VTGTDVDDDVDDVDADVDDDIDDEESDMIIISMYRNNFSN
jgi:hypothetical protein